MKLLIERFKKHAPHDSNSALTLYDFVCKEKDTGLFPGIRFYIVLGDTDISHNNWVVWLSVF